MRRLTYQVLLAIFSLLLSNLALSQTAPPPTLGEQTKGEPAIEESAETETETVASDAAEASSEEESESIEGGGILGQATITESRRENGQVYLIEMEHSAGSKMILEENDSDGKIEPSDNDLDSEPNIPKWRLGRW